MRGKKNGCQKIETFFFRSVFFGGKNLLCPKTVELVLYQTFSPQLLEGEFELKMSAPQVVSAIGPPPSSHQAQKNTGPPDIEPEVYALVLDLSNSEKREAALLELSKKRESVPELAPVLHNTTIKKLE